MESLAPLQQFAVYGTLASLGLLMVSEFFAPKQKGFNCDESCKGCEACTPKTFTKHGRVFTDKQNKIFYTENNEPNGKRIVFEKKEVK